jgi:hypothetical protein
VANIAAGLYWHLPPVKTVPDQLVVISAEVVTGFRLDGSSSAGSAR